MRGLLVFVLLMSVALAQDKLILSTEPPPPLPKKPPKQTGCAIQDLYVIGWTVHDPAERHKAMLEWLDKTKCSNDDYVLIWNSLPEWAGTSDSPLLRAKIMEKAK